MVEVEEPLVGGRVTAGVVKVGDTVRRPVRGDPAFRHGLLAHLESKGFQAAPRFLGIDEMGREILGFLAGDVPGDLGHYQDEQLRAAAALLRRFHDATADFPAVQQQAKEVVCHNDWGPPNAVFRGGLPCGMIDFDAAAPGLRLWDLGYAAFAWLDLGNSAYTAADQLRRLTVFAEAYDLPACPVSGIAAGAVARQSALAARATAEGQSAMAAWAASAADWTVTNILKRLPPGASPA